MVVPDVRSSRQETEEVVDQYGPVRLYGGYRFFGFDHSVLLQEKYRMVDGFRWWVAYLPLWVTFMLVSLITAVVVWTWRIVVRPKDPEEWLLGPEWHVPLGYGKHPIGRQIRRSVRSVAALDPIYHLPLWLGKPQNMSEALLWLVYQQPEARGVRNRLKITAERSFLHFVTLYMRGERKIVVCSLACGSAQAMLDGAFRFLQHVGDPEMEFEFHFVDRDEEALKVAFEYATNVLRMPDSWINIHQSNLRDFLEPRIKEGWKVHEVEFVGFADYLSVDKEAEYFDLARQILLPGGMLVTAHINRSIWGFVVRWGTNWVQLKRRMPWTLKRVLQRAGFKRVNLIIEPCLAHTIAECFRTDSDIA